LSSNVLPKPRVQLWQIIVIASVCAYLALGVATESVRVYHWFLLLAIPIAIFAPGYGRRFFVDWAPLFAFWIVYDRLRLVQPLLLNRVAVRPAYLLECWAFGWMAGGRAPAHASREWLAQHGGTILGDAASWVFQFVYFSQIIVLPLMMLYWWWRGWRHSSDRARFVRHLTGFTALHVLGLLLYVIMPVAPPWWVSLHGFAQPDAGLLAETNMAAAMDGAVVQQMIQTAPHWFAAVPSLHGAYPVLMLLLSAGERRWPVIALLAAYSAVMWVATVALNQHYIIDLLAGAAVASIALWFANQVNRRSKYE
jgi:membrane-associated phospholipid phosphatase